MRLRLWPVRTCLPTLAFFPVRKWVANLVPTAPQRPLIYLPHPCPTWSQRNRKTEALTLRERPHTIIHHFHHFMSPRLMTMGCIIALLQPVATNGIVALGTIVLSTTTPQDANPARCHMRHTSVRRPESTLLGMAVPRTSGILIFRLHPQPLRSLPRGCRFWGLITFEIIVRMDTQPLIKTPSGRRLILARLELIQNFRLPLVNLPRSSTKGNDLHHDLTHKHIFECIF